MEIRNWRIIEFILFIIGILIMSIVLITKNTGKIEPEQVSIIDCFPLKGMYKPGEKAVLKTCIKSLLKSKLNLYLEVEFYENFKKLSSVVKDVVVQPESKTEVFIEWRTPEEDMKGYGVIAFLKSSSGKIFSTRSTAIDVGGDWTKKPRYGFMSDFNVNEKDLINKFESLCKFHINSLQFYDWFYRHSEHIPHTDNFIDPLGRPLSIDIVEQKIDLAHKYGMATMAYVTIYGAPIDFYEKHLEWALYHANGEPWRLGDDFLIIMNPATGSPWRDYILSDYQKILSTLNFDGIHIDQYGDPKMGHSQVEGKEGEVVDLGKEIPTFINEAKKIISKVRPNMKVFFNNVTNWPVQTVGPSDVDTIYIEVWPPFTFFQHLKELIDKGKKFSNGKPVILAAYISPQYKPSILLTNATIFANGGYHIELGEGNGMLADPYFPKYEQMNKDLYEQLRNYYDFTVRYQELLYGDLRETELAQKVKIEGVKTLDKGYYRLVWVITRENENYQVVNLINLLDLEEPEWNATRTKLPRILENVEVMIPSPNSPSRIYFLSPDFNDGWPEELRFSYQNGIISFNLPRLEYWDMIILER